MKLIFVYNANSGKLNALFDIAHKMINPETYKCSLCAITHGTLTEKKAWKDFKTKTELKFEFLHKDEFEKKYKQTYDYPVILENEETLKIAISSKILNEIKDVEELIKYLK